jgi:hypothetical protein
MARAATYRIAGIVVSKADDHPLAHAHVVVANVKDSKQIFSAVTGEDGKFEFSELPAGKYTLQGERRGFESAGYDQHEQFFTAIVTGAGLDTERLILRLPPEAYIFGNVFDEAGEPVRHANVRLYLLSHEQGVQRIVPARDSQTDDLGAYELGPQLPGTYFVSVSATPWYAVHPVKSVRGAQAQVDSSLDVAYPVTYYGDGIDSDAATPINLRAGDRVEADIHLNPVPSLHLRLPTLLRSPKGIYFYPQLFQSGLGEDSGVQGISFQVNDNTMEIVGISPGKYTLRVPGADGAAGQVKEIDLENDGPLDLSAAEALSEVKIVVNMPPGENVPPRLSIGLRSSRGTIQSWNTLDAKGEANLQQVPPGQYEVVAWNSGKYSVSRVSAESAEVSDRNVNIAAGSSLTLKASLVAAVGSVEGFVKKNGKPAAGAMVVLVPENPAMNRELFRRDQSDLDGSFSLNNVIPGKYTVVAIQDGWDLDWSQEDVISAYLQRGKEIEVAPQHKPNVLPQPVEIQPK